MVIIRSRDHMLSQFFFLQDTAPTETYTLSLHDALPISHLAEITGEHVRAADDAGRQLGRANMRSEEHTSELQSPYDLVCRLLLEKKKLRSNWSQHWRRP